jgi:membrane-associated phospholipid phosphatase
MNAFNLQLVAILKVLFLLVVLLSKRNSYKKSALWLFLCLSLSSPLNAQNTTIRDNGDILLYALPAATLATTFIIGDTKGSWQFAKGLLLTEAITYGLKLAINKPRPDQSNKNSFPSGHTSTVFHSASFIHQRYGVTYSIPAYALASFTAFSRIYAEKHDGWDVLAGAVVGIGSSCLFTTPYQKEHIELTFNEWNGDYLLGFKYEF